MMDPRMKEGTKTQKYGRSSNRVKDFIQLKDNSSVLITLNILKCNPLKCIIDDEQS